jgi:hypothetical protein
MAFGVIAVIAVLAAVALVAFRTPTERAATKDVDYEQAGDFSYSARAQQGSAYADPNVTTGQPLFLNLVRQVRFAFDYRFSSKAPHDVSGDLALSAELGDGRGWARPFVLAEPKRFRGGHARVTGTLDLREVARLLAGLQRETGALASAHTLTITPSVVVDGTLERGPLNATFAPPLQFDLDTVSMRMRAPSADVTGRAPADPLKPSATGTVERDTTEPNVATLLGREIPVTTMRMGAGIGVLAALAFGLFMFAGFARQRRLDNDVARIESRYGPALVDVRTFTPDSNRPAVEVASFDQLARLADHHERMILHRDDGDGFHSFYLDTEGLMYWFRARNGLTTAMPASSPPPPPPPPPPVHGPVGGA